MAATDPVQQLLRRLQPIRAGSLLVTVFGDGIAPRGGAVTLGSLIALAAPFGITDRHVRTAVGRLAREGWFSAQRDGRRAEYQLTDHGAERFREATQRIYGRNPLTWDGQWTLLLLTAAGRRAEGVREQLHWLGFGQLEASVFIHPNPRLLLERQWLRELSLRDAVLMASRTDDDAVDRQLVASGWDLQQLARAYRRFVANFQPLAGSNARQLEPQDCFIVRTLLIHEYRKIHLQDPLLPPSLLPPEWIGAVAYELCASLYGSVSARAERYLSDTAGTLRGALPSPDHASEERFGVGTLSLPAAAGTAQTPAETGLRAARP